MDVAVSIDDDSIKEAKCSDWEDEVDASEQLDDVDGGEGSKVMAVIPLSPVDTEKDIASNKEKLSI